MRVCRVSPGDHMSPRSREGSRRKRWNAAPRDRAQSGCAIRARSPAAPRPPPRPLTRRPCRSCR
eukprot:2024498-Prymnesium_polylepis.1